MKQIFLFGIILTIFSACNLSSDKSDEAYQRYQIETAVVRYNTDLMGIQSESVLYFTDYGRKETTDSKAVFMGQESYSRQFVKGDYAYTLDMKNMSGSKMKVSALPDSVMNPEDIDFNNIPPKIKERYNIQQTGEETVLGKECKVYSMEIKPGTARQVISVWNNIPLKIEFTDEGVHIVTVATEIDESPNISEEVFEVPANFKIIEYQPDSVKSESTDELPT